MSGSSLRSCMHRGPDVIEELDLDHRLQSARGHADGAADDVGLRQRRVEDAVGAELALQSGGQLEDAALALDLLLLADILRGCNRPRLRRTSRCAHRAASRLAGMALIRSAMVLGCAAFAVVGGRDARLRSRNADDVGSRSGE